MAKKYINGVFIREHTFNEGGSVLNVRIPADKIESLAAQLLAAVDDGWVKLRISANKNPTINRDGKVIATHSLAVDDWKPSGPSRQRQQPKASEPEHDGGASDVPF